jgi:RNA 2',3'-cyclic 3'-phosphodiesterase
MIRTFIAVELTEEIRAAAAQVVSRIRQTAPEESGGAVWVRSQSMHITLKFIGWAAEGSMAEVKQALKKAARAVAVFDAEFASPGGFPNLNRPRVLWVGLRQGSTEMTRLRDSVESLVAPIGFPTEERPFHAHVTLGRVKDAQSSKPLGAALRSLGDVTLGRMSVGEVTLFQSELKPSGAVYTPLGRFPLAPPPAFPAV